MTASFLMRCQNLLRYFTPEMIHFQTQIFFFFTNIDLLQLLLSLDFVSIYAILQFEISSLMNLIFSLVQTWILQATANRKIQFKLGKKTKERKFCENFLKIQDSLKHVITTLQDQLDIIFNVKFELISISISYHFFFLIKKEICWQFSQTVDTNKYSILASSNTCVTNQEINFLSKCHSI